MTHHYPFRSRLKRDMQKLQEAKDYYLWQDNGLITDILSHTQGPIVEIGGPSDEGYFFLDNVTLSAKTHVTNISADPLPYSPDAKKLAGLVDEIVDGTQTGYADNSVGMFLMSYMSPSSDWWVGLDYEQKKAAEPQFSAEAQTARMEMEQVAIGTLAPDKAKQAMRVRIYLEMHRALKQDGLIVANGKAEDIIILQRIGFRLLAVLQYLPGNDKAQGFQYEFVMTKI